MTPSLIGVVKKSGCGKRRSGQMLEERGSGRESERERGEKGRIIKFLPGFCIETFFPSIITIMVPSDFT